MTRDHAKLAPRRLALAIALSLPAAAAFAQDAAADPAATAGKPDAAAVLDQIQVTDQDLPVGWPENSRDEELPIEMA